MRIGELAERSGLTTQTLRFYEQAGVLPAPTRSRSGYRDYDDAALPRLRFIRAAQCAGLSLSELRQIMVIRDNDGPPCAHVIALLTDHLGDLETRLAKLTAMRREVKGLLERARTLDPQRCSEDDVCHVIPSSRPSA